MEKDNQWPMGTFLPLRDPGEGTPAERERLTEAIEACFEARWPGTQVVLTSSGRAGLFLALSTLGAGRGQVVQAPRWSSHCVWDVLGRLANPAVDFSAEPDFAVMVHKYGYATGLAEAHRAVRLDDSCDSLPGTGAGLFPTGAVCELFSLPKVLGVCGGGLLATRDGALAREWRSASRRFDAASLAQSRRRAAMARGEDLHDVWTALEYRGGGMDLTLLAHIHENLGRWEQNAETIARRLELVGRRRPDWLAWTARMLPTRMPPVLPLPPELAAELPSKMLDVAGLADRPAFVRHPILPLHLGVGDSWFLDTLDQLCRSNS